MKGNSGVDQIADSRGKDKLLLTNYSQFGTSALDVNKNGKADSLGIYLDPKGKPIIERCDHIGLFRLEALNNELVGVVRETMQPAHVSLWLRPATASKGQQTD